MMSTTRTFRIGAFTLLEVLVSIGVVGLLVSLALPGLARARAQGQRSVCQSNLRQLVFANQLYAQDARGVFVPGAADFTANLHRWHGSRANTTEPFKPADGPLNLYLGEENGIRRCPGFEPEKRGFETGNGGYGYNNAYIGVETVVNRRGRTIVVSDGRGATADKVRRPAETLMFADSAFVEGELIEYSFAEPRFHPQFGGRADPSIHFRHAGATSAGWCDGHVTAETRTFTWSSGFYPGDSNRAGLGWFGKTDDNACFDLR